MGGLQPVRTRDEVLGIVGADAFARWELPDRLPYGVARGGRSPSSDALSLHHASLTFLGDDAALLGLVTSLADADAWPEVDDLSLTVPRRLRDAVTAAFAPRGALGEGAAWTWMWTDAPPPAPGLPPRTRRRAPRRPR